MGRYGSGWQGSKRRTVEDGLILSSTTLARLGLLRPNERRAGNVTWTNGLTGERAASIGCDPELGPEAGTVRLHYTWDGTEHVNHRVRVTSTPFPWGGGRHRRWWFACPLAIDGKTCGRRCGKLYLPPGGRHFGCRRCHGLTYTSCQESHKNDAWAAAIGRDVGMSSREVLRMLRD